MVSDWAKHSCGEGDANIDASFMHRRALAYERGVLAVFYTETNGPAWKRRGWIAGPALREWQGVQTNSKGFVVSINLERVSDLTGVLPKNLWTLERCILEAQWHLRRTNILTLLSPHSFFSMHSFVAFSTKLGGPLTLQPTSLSRLRCLRLNNTRISGPFPAALCDLGALQELRLNDTKLSGELPANIGRLTSLEVTST